MDHIALKKTTTDLLQELKNTAHIEDYFKENRECLRADNFLEELERLYRLQGRKKAEIARESAISEIYLYQIFAGKRIPTRDRLVCICLGMHLSEEDAQHLLRLCGHSPLYARDKRDAVLLHGLMHRTPVGEVNGLLIENGCDALLG